MPLRDGPDVGSCQGTHPDVGAAFDFTDVRGVIPLTQGLEFDDRLNLFKEKVELAFGLPSTLSQSAWERKRDRVIDRINAKIATAATPRLAARSTAVSST